MSFEIIVGYEIPNPIITIYKGEDIYLQKQCNSKKV